MTSQVSQAQAGKQKSRFPRWLILSVTVLIFACLFATVIITIIAVRDYNATPRIIEDIQVNARTTDYQLSTAQREVIDDNGYPDGFTLLFYDDESTGKVTRFETWLYLLPGMQYSFLNGEYQGVEYIAAIDREVLDMPYYPEQFTAYMSLEQVLSAAELTEMMVMPLEEALVPGGQSFFGDRITFGLKNDELMYLETLPFVSDKVIAEAPAIPDDGDDPFALPELAPTATPEPEPAPTATPELELGPPLVWVTEANDPNWPDCEDTDAGCHTDLMLQYPESGEFYELNLTADYDFDYVLTPAISNDGTRVAFGGARGDATDIYIMDIEGNNLEQVTFDGAGGFNFRPVWLGEDTAIGYISNRDGNKRWNFFLQDLIMGDSMAFNSPEYESGQWNGGVYNIRFMDMYFGEDLEYFVLSTDLADPNPGECYPDCQWGLYLYSDLDEELIPLDFGIPAIGGPAISPDGRYIAFHAQIDGLWQIFIYDLVDDSLRHFSDMEGEHEFTHPKWSPDGQSLAFTMHWDVSVSDLDVAISAVDDFDPASYTPFGADYDPDW
ncbi:MAG: PD40 domain-containing protein [Anaerolineales bacterium]|nr:PD40 domain-containing protein [Anaerolineales bacterium]